MTEPPQSRGLYLVCRLGRTILEAVGDRPLILPTLCCPSYFNKLPGVTPNRCLNAR